MDDVAHLVSQLEAHDIIHSQLQDEVAYRDERLRERDYSLRLSNAINSQLIEEVAAVRRSLELLQIQQVSTSLA